MATIGSICIGLVWGWLARMVHRPAVHHRHAALILLLVTAAFAAGLWWQLGRRSGGEGGDSGARAWGFTALGLVLRN